MIACAFAAGRASPTAHERLQSQAQSITFDWAKAHPLPAKSLGLSDEDGLLDTPSEAQNGRDLAMIRGWESELASIPLARASLMDVDDAKLLDAQLTGYERQYLLYKTYAKDLSSPMAIVRAIYTQFLHLFIAGTGGATQADADLAWQRIIDRLTGAPAFIAAGNALVTHPGHLYGVTGAEQLAGAPGFFKGSLTDAANSQLPAERFAAFVKARDMALAAMQQSKKYIDEHAAAWPENATSRCCRSTPTILSEWRRMNWRTDGRCRSGWKNSPPSAAHPSGRRAAGAWLRAAPR